MAERGRYDDIFLKTDTDLDGFVSGQEVKDIFMHSGLSQNILAHIWYVLKWLPPSFKTAYTYRSCSAQQLVTLLGLCVLLPCRALADTRQIGKLTREQFSLAMHFIQQKVIKGVDPPQSLTADMIPPTERGTPITVGPTDKFYIFIIGYD